MPKFPIKSVSTTSTIDPSVTKAVTKSTPLVYAFCEKIMSHVNEDSTKNLTVVEKQILDLFATFPNDENTVRLAKLTELLTGIKLDMRKGPWQIGQMYKNNGVLYAVVLIDTNYAYGINSSSTSFTCINKNTVRTGSYAVTVAETGLFCKELLNISGARLIKFLSVNISGSIPQVLEAVGDVIKI